MSDDNYFDDFTTSDSAIDQIIRADSLLSANELSEKYERDSSSWVYHPVYGRQDWVNDVQNNDTRSGYWDWVANQIACRLDELAPQ